ncbi:MAG: hypothetical protein CL868_01295 [Cytophagaceae bacterium]|nr:hypothetical protein [Cytophagaceae bacterium]
MAMIAILIIGAEAVLLCLPARMMRWAMKYSKFNTAMAFNLPKITLFLAITVMISCANGVKDDSQKIKDKRLDSIKTENTIAQNQKSSIVNQEIILGANRTEAYIPLLQGKRIGIVGNPSSLILKKDGRTYTHLVDSLLLRKLNIVKVFSPEHGFRGTADAGEKVKDGKDLKTGLPIVSLYGNNRKPKPEQVKDLDILVFDIQDVGVRFYTYVATMHYVMQAAAENNIEIIVLDRPDPNGSYVDGPVMEAAHTSFLGMHAGVPLVHGMTVGEYAQMINGEGWLGDGLTAKLTVIPMKNYNHALAYSLPVRPSPNLPNDQSINLYPSLGLCEGTNLNAGRGTEMQFQVLGSPYLPAGQYTLSYTPVPNFGSKSPKHNGELCHGIDLRQVPPMHEVDLSWIIDAYHAHTNKENFFLTSGFTKHAGTDTLQKQIESGMTMDEIRESWQPGLAAFKKIRARYVLYK